MRLNKKQQQARTGLKPDDFKNDQRVISCVSEINKIFKNNKVPKVVSDVVDEEGNQYVNLVQKGGGVLGVALVGYTYILEQAGIRFLKLAGTSAGAINTALLTAAGEKGKCNTDTLIRALSDLDLSNLVDGHRFARIVIKNFVTKPDFFGRIKGWLTARVVFFVVLLALCFTFLGLEHKFIWMERITVCMYVLTGLYALYIAALVSYGASLIKRLKIAGFGINPGDYFYNWVKSQFLIKKVVTVADLQAKAAETPFLKLRAGVKSKKGINELAGSVTFIASELVTQSKIEFPGMCDLFRTSFQADPLEPAGFVRASMSIPIFFESYFINKIPCNDPDIKRLWKEKLNVDIPPETARFVDGGILSNFPINLFYDPTMPVPRLPTFGIDLDDSTVEDKKNSPQGWSLGGYLGRMFNTIRFYYDKDFLIKNRIMEKGIGKVPVSDFNWLNFFLTNKEKIDLFAKGAQAAVVFLNGFDWDSYKSNRHQYFKSNYQNLSSSVPLLTKIHAAIFKDKK